MAAGQHNPSRRALLGAALALPMVTQVPSGLPRLARNAREDWVRALAMFESAETALRAIERRSAGASAAEQSALEEEYGDGLDLLYSALRRLLRVPAPDLAAFAVKIELVIDHEVATLTGGEACLAAVRRDVRQLAG